jgi:hypothetical protein
MILRHHDPILLYMFLYRLQCKKKCIDSTIRDNYEFTEGLAYIVVFFFATGFQR